MDVGSKSFVKDQVNCDICETSTRTQHTTTTDDTRPQRSLQGYALLAGHYVFLCCHTAAESNRKKNINIAVLFIKRTVDRYTLPAHNLITHHSSLITHHAVTAAVCDASLMHIACMIHIYHHHRHQGALLCCLSTLLGCEHIFGGIDTSHSRQHQSPFSEH